MSPTTTRCLFGHVACTYVLIALLCHQAGALIPSSRCMGGADARTAAVGYFYGGNATVAESSPSKPVRLLSATPRKRRLHNYGPLTPRDDIDDDDDDVAANGAPYRRFRPGPASLSPPPPLSAQVRRIHPSHARTSTAKRQDEMRTHQIMCVYMYVCRRCSGGGSATRPGAAASSCTWCDRPPLPLALSLPHHHLPRPPLAPGAVAVGAGGCAAGKGMVGGEGAPLARLDAHSFDPGSPIPCFYPDTRYAPSARLDTRHRSFAHPHSHLSHSCMTNGGRPPCRSQSTG